jgi:hypothetical protein
VAGLPGELLEVLAMVVPSGKTRASERVHTMRQEPHGFLNS